MSKSKELRRITSKYDATCRVCKKALLAGSVVLWKHDYVQCITCPKPDKHANVCKTCNGPLTPENTSKLPNGDIWHVLQHMSHNSGIKVTKPAPKPMEPVHERLARICCPKCGNVAGSESEEDRIEYVETFDMYRIVSLNPDGQLEVTRTSAFVEGSDGDGKNPRFRCQASKPDGTWCGHTWPVPKWVDDALWELV